MLETGRFQGFHYPVERYADSRPFYREILANEPGVNGRETDLARESLAFFERFPPEVEHTRTVGHKVQVIQLNKPEWQRRGKLLVPTNSDPVTLANIDLTEEVRKACEEDSKPGEVLEENAEYWLPDGTKIVGARVKTPHSGTPSERQLVFPGLRIRYDLQGYQERGEWGYVFDIDSSAITSGRPLEFLISLSVMVDGITIHEKQERAQPLFATNGQIPTKFDHMVYSTINETLMFK